MMSVMSTDRGNPTKMKRKLMISDTAKEETRSFLDFSRENLSISQANLHQGFDRSQLRPSRNTILSSAALVIAVLCLSLEGWRLQCSLSNTREIEQLKRDVKDLKQRFLRQNLINGFKVIEQQIYGGVSAEDNDSSEADIDNDDYDFNYDDDNDDDDDDFTSYDYTTDYHTLSTHATESSDPSKNTSTPTPTSGPNKTTIELLTVVRKAQTSRPEEFDKNGDRVKEEHEALTDQNTDDPNNGKRKRDTVARDTANTGYVPRNSKRKRFVRDHAATDDSFVHTTRYERNEQRQVRLNTLKMYPPGENDTDDYFEDDAASNSGKWLGVAVENKTNHHKHPQSLETVSRDLDPKTARKNLRVPRHIRAIHYEADGRSFQTQSDEHVGNGKIKHSNGIFKPWRESDWVSDLGMNRFFSLTIDGKLIVYESGLYLVYAQIHYLDEHDESGFHLLVNDRPVLQCTVYSPGMGHKSRSCFTAQLVVLQLFDRLLLKEVGSPRYTLFQPDKSFIGLVKLGEVRTPKHQTPRTTDRDE